MYFLPVDTITTAQPETVAASGSYAADTSVPATPVAERPRPAKRVLTLVPYRRGYLSADSILSVRARRLSSDTLADDTVTNKELPVSKPTQGLVLTSVAEPIKGEKINANSDVIFSSIGILTAILIVAAAMKYRTNARFFRSLVHQLISNRPRDNMFDDTVRESIFTLILNALGAVVSGIMLSIGIACYSGQMLPTALQVVVGIGIGSAYALVMPAIYMSTAWVFSDALHARLWLRGFYAAQALSGILLLVPALLALFYPQWAQSLVAIGAGIWGLIRILFIFKSLRFFFNRISMFIPFLCYLCGVEIVPLAACWRAAVYLSGKAVC